MAEDQEKGKLVGKDEGEDVEGHKHKNMNLEADEVQLAKDDEGDDVEGHANLNAVNISKHKA